MGDQHEGNDGSSDERRGRLKRKLEPDFEDRKEDANLLARQSRVRPHVDILNSFVEPSGDQVHSNPGITSTSFCMPSRQTLPSPCPTFSNYDVFLSFRGEDTRKSFTDHLYSALTRVGIRTFRDEGELPRGENISTELHNAIHGSKISIVVFSKGYASSKWCLDELVEIMHCAKIRGQTVLPIFYHVEPSGIRKQTGTFADAFASHEDIFQNDMERVKGWRAALREAALRSGLDVKEVANGNESRLIDKIVEEVSSKLKPAEYLDVAIHPVGVNSRVEEMKALLNLEKSDVRIVGIYGMEGIGKTTIAKAVYNQICDAFGGSSCLFNIKEKSKQFNGLLNLQKQLLFDILKMKKFRIDSVDRGIKLIQERIQGRRVLVVLDDVDDWKQIYYLVGKYKWFGQGSRVIITTRKEHLLTQAKANEKYEVRKLDELESLQLFSWHAFGMAQPIEDYLDLSISAVRFAGGLPLDLEDLGCTLSGRTVIQWKNKLEKLQKEKAWMKATRRTDDAPTGTLVPFNETGRLLLFSVEAKLEAISESLASLQKQGNRERRVHSNLGITSTSFSMPYRQTLPSPCPTSSKYEVFLSFRGEDTRKNFTDHLYSALRRVGILAFRDEGELPKGENISTELHNAIHGSKFSIVVFSEGYAYSKRCLNELVEIMHCAKIRGQTLLPIFYHVHPSDVRKQSGTFADAFARHEELFQNDGERVKRWRAALREAASRSGWDIREVANGYESRLIDRIVEEVLRKLKPAEYLDVADHPVGVNSRVEEMKALLDLETSEARIVGIYGMCGIGKTTIAKAVYNQIRDTFEGSSCLFNIKEKSEQCNGLVHLQKQLLFDILKMKKFRIDSVDRGTRLIQERIQGKRVLLVLDDVDDLKQIDALVGQCKWFGPGSRVIITTRNEHLLTQAKVNGKYEVRKLDGFESLLLFSRHAFRMAHSREDYLDLSISVVKYAGGLPLALEILGRFLLGRSAIE